MELWDAYYEGGTPAGRDLIRGETVSYLWLSRGAFLALLRSEQYVPSARGAAFAEFGACIALNYKSG